MSTFSKYITEIKYINNDSNNNKTQGTYFQENLEIFDANNKNEQNHISKVSSFT